MEYYETKNNHKYGHNRHSDYREFFEFARKGFTFILTVERFLLTADRAYSAGIARLYHYYYYQKQRAKCAEYQTGQTNELLFSPRI